MEMMLKLMKACTPDNCKHRISRLCKLSPFKVYFGSICADCALLPAATCWAMMLWSACRTPMSSSLVWEAWEWRLPRMSSWEEFEVWLCTTKELQNGGIFPPRCVQGCMDHSLALSYNTVWNGLLCNIFVFLLVLGFNPNSQMQLISIWVTCVALFPSKTTIAATPTAAHHSLTRIHQQVVSGSSSE